VTYFSPVASRIPFEVSAHLAAFMSPAVVLNERKVSPRNIFDIGFDALPCDADRFIHHDELQNHASWSCLVCRSVLVRMRIPIVGEDLSFQVKSYGDPVR
jgi:hypothetical protein